MKVFQQTEIRAARDYAASGGQAVHLCSSAYVPPDAPRVFVQSREFAHLFDNDKCRLVATAKRLGVHVVVVDRDGMPGQHVDLVGAPLKRAIAEANETPAEVQGELF
jgi:hypothetical protein